MAPIISYFCLVFFMSSWLLFLVGWYGTIVSEYGAYWKKVFCYEYMKSAIIIWRLSFFTRNRKTDAYHLFWIMQFWLFVCRTCFWVYDICTCIFILQMKWISTNCFVTTFMMLGLFFKWFRVIVLTSLQWLLILYFLVCASVLLVN